MNIADTVSIVDILYVDTIDITRYHFNLLSSHWHSAVAPYSLFVTRYLQAPGHGEGRHGCR